MVKNTLRAVGLWLLALCLFAVPLWLLQGTLLRFRAREAFGEVPALFFLHGFLVGTFTMTALGMGIVMSYCAVRASFEPGSGRNRAFRLVVVAEIVVFIVAVFLLLWRTPVIGDVLQQFYTQ